MSEAMDVLTLEIQAQKKVVDYWTKEAQEVGDDSAFQFLDRARYGLNLLEEVKQQMVSNELADIKRRLDDI